MSYYQFQGPVQGGFGPAFDDDEQRRRKKHHRDAGAPYSGGISSMPSARPLEPAPSIIQNPVSYDIHDIQPKAGAAPRMSAAVDMGDGPVQQAIPQQAAAATADVFEQKRLAGAHFAPMVGAAGLSKKPGFGDPFPDLPDPHAYDPHALIGPAPDPYEDVMPPVPRAPYKADRSGLCRSRQHSRRLCRGRLRCPACRGMCLRSRSRRRCRRRCLTTRRKPRCRYKRNRKRCGPRSGAALGARPVRRNRRPCPLPRGPRAVSSTP